MKTKFFLLFSSKIRCAEKKVGSGKNVSSRNNSKWEPIYYIALPHEWVTHFSSHFFPFFSAARKIFTENSPENVKITRKFTKMRRKTRKTSEFYTFSGAPLPEMGKIIQQISLNFCLFHLRVTWS